MNVCLKHQYVKLIRGMKKMNRQKEEQKRRIALEFAAPETLLELVGWYE